MTSKIALTYGGALYDLAREEALEAQVLEELETLCGVFSQTPEYYQLLLTPSIEKAARGKLLDEAFRGSVHPYTLNFLKLLCENGAIRQLPDCLEVFRGRYNTDHDILTVCAVSAAPLSEAQLARLREAIAARYQKTVELRTRVDASLLGGIRLELPDRQLDGSVQHHLRQLQQMLERSAL